MTRMLYYNGQLLLVVDKYGQAPNYLRWTAHSSGSEFATLEDDDDDDEDE